MKPTVPFRFMMFPLYVAVAILCACGGGEKKSDAGAQPADGPKPKREVIVFSPHGQEMLDEYEKAFEAAHPDIDLIGRFIPTGKILSQLRIDKDKPTIDVWWGGTSSFFNQAKDDGLLRAYKPSWAEHSKPEYHDPANFWYAQFIQVPAVMFNNAIYKTEDIPDSWEGLCAFRWKDKIVIREPMDSGTMKTIFSGLVWMMGGSTGNSEPGYKFLKRLDAQTKTYLPDPQALYDRIAKSEEGYISLWNVTDIIFQAEANEYPFGYRIPSGPVPISVDPIGLVANSPNSAEAELFYEFVTSRENCLKMAKDHYRILARTDIAPEELPEKMKAIAFEPLAFDAAAFDKAQIEWMDHWSKSIRDPGK